VVTVAAKDRPTVARVELLTGGRKVHWLTDGRKVVEDHRKAADHPFVLYEQPATSQSIRYRYVLGGPTLGAVLKKAGRS
jgi:hypothetical protein